MLALLAIVQATSGWPQQPPSFPSTCSAGSVAWRTVHVLSGNWEFSFLRNYATNATVSLNGINFNRTQIVPAAWDAAWGTGLQYERGVGVYRTSVAVRPGRPLALHFAACSLFCRVYVDGALIHNHTLGGFTPFSVSVPPSPSSSREVVVLTSNVFDRDLTPTQAQNYDFYQYGGLLRAVCLHELPVAGPSIQRIEVKPLSTAGSGGVPSGEVNITVVLSAAAVDIPIELEFGWDCPQAFCGSGFNGSYRPINGVIFLPSVAVPNPRVWQPVERPTAVPSLHLHNLTGAANESIQRIRSHPTDPNPLQPHTTLLQPPQFTPLQPHPTQSHTATPLHPTSSHHSYTPLHPHHNHTSPHYTTTPHYTPLQPRYNPITATPLHPITTPPHPITATPHSTP